MLHIASRIASIALRRARAGLMNWCATTRRRQRTRGGVSLMEVLISVFVLSVGLLGMAALIPVGRLAMVETGKHDRSGSAGRAIMRSVQVRRMLDYTTWQPGVPNPNTNTTLPPFAIDPLGVARGLGNAPLGGAGSPIARLTLGWIGTNVDLARQVCCCREDFDFRVPEDRLFRPEVPFQNNLLVPGASEIIPTGNFSWLLTVCPSPAEAAVPIHWKSQYTVSVAICYKRNFDVNPPRESTPGVFDYRPGEVAVEAQFIDAAGGGIAIGGGSVQLSKRVYIRENEWVLLYDASSPVGHPLKQCKWYRVVAAGENPTNLLTLAGPDWNAALCPRPLCVIIDSVIGVYTTSVELDGFNPVWNKR